MKKRVITIFTYKNHTLVKSVKYKDYRNVNSIHSAVKLFNKKGIDEIIFLNLDSHIDFDVLKSFVNEADVPITYGGQINTIDEMKLLFKIGFDKICINSLLFTNINIVKEASEIFGKQSICASIDVRFINDDYYCYYNNATINSNYTLKNFLESMVKLDYIGEFVITSVDRDGTMQGYDHNLYNIIIDIPIRIIVNGGGNSDVSNLNIIKNKNVQGICISSLFFFTYFTPKIIKNYLKDMTPIVNL